MYNDIRTFIMFIDVKTNKGVFTLSVYNTHNGCYGHPVYYRITNITNNIIEFEEKGYL